jgi:hypothetical protein
MTKSEVNAGARVKTPAYKAGEAVTSTVVGGAGVLAAFVVGVAATGYEVARDFAQGLLHFPNA